MPSNKSLKRTALRATDQFGSLCGLRIELRREDDGFG